MSLKNKKNIILDQTNLSRKSRLEKLKLVPKDYEKVCIFFMTPKDLKVWMMSDQLFSRRPKISAA